MLTRRAGGLAHRGVPALLQRSRLSGAVLSKPAVATGRPRLASRRLTSTSAVLQNSPQQQQSSAATSAQPLSQSSTVKDLSYVSEPMGALFPLFTPSRASLSPFLLSEEQVAFYHENGYISNIPALSVEQCDAILADYRQFLLWDQPQPSSPSSLSRDDAHRLQHPGLHLFHEFHSNQTGDANNVLSHMLGHWRISPLFHDLPFHPALTVPSSQLMAAFFSPIPSSPELSASRDGLLPVSFWHDQLFAKPAQYGGNVAWHQDYSYWTRTGPCNHITVHLALDDQTLENGSLHFIPRSHRWTRQQYNPHSQQTETLPLPVTDFNFADMQGINSVLTEQEKAAFAPVPGLLKKGEISIHHPFLVHGSFPNRSDKPRRAAVVNYFVTGTVSQTDEPLLAGMEVIPRGSKLVSRFFPVVFRPEWMDR